MCRSIRSLNFELFPPSPPLAFKLFPPSPHQTFKLWRLVRSNSRPRGENCSQRPYPCTILWLKILWVIMQRTFLNSIIKATHSQTRIKLYRVKRSPCFKRSVVKTRTFFLDQFIQQSPWNILELERDYIIFFEDIINITCQSNRS